MEIILSVGNNMYFRVDIVTFPISSTMVDCQAKSNTAIRNAQCQRNCKISIAQSLFLLKKQQNLARQMQKSR